MLDFTINSSFKILNIILWVLFLIGNFLSYYAFGRYILELVYQTTKEKNEQ
jgi:Sec-independent protein secretion pathway component TatC